MNNKEVFEEMNTINSRGISQEDYDRARYQDDEPECDYDGEEYQEDTAMMLTVILTIKNGNRASDNICREIDMTPAEYDYIKECARNIEALSGQQFVSAYIKCFGSEELCGSK